MKTGPKNALSAYIYYSQENRAKVLASNPGIAFAEVAKTLGSMWKECTAADKAPYELLAAQDKERYKRDLENGVIAEPKKTLKKMKEHTNDTAA